MHYHVEFSTTASALLQTTGGDTSEGNDQLSHQNQRVVASCYHSESHILVLTFTSGDFVVLDMRDGCDMLHTLNASNQVRLG